MPSPLTPTKTEFIEFCLANQVLRFGEFTLKSARTSPYFFNAGLFNRGDLLRQLGRYYAQLITTKRENTPPNHAPNPPPFMLYGPAYKGIPLAVATVQALAEHHNLAIPYAFHRKEAKTHGEGGHLIGADLTGEVIIIDDVITSATSIHQAIEAIHATSARVTMVVIALDRQEKREDQSANSAAQYLTQTYQIPVHPLITLQDLLTYLATPAAQNHIQDPAQHTRAIQTYRAQHGATT